MNLLMQSKAVFIRIAFNFQNSAQRIISLLNSLLDATFKVKSEKIVPSVPPASSHNLMKDPLPNAA